jgi:tRNA(fMet)-specific endonuclease VapC
MQAISDLLMRAGVIEVTTTIAERFGEVRAQQFASGQFTPEMDLLIASTALVHGLTLVTHNIQDFAAVPGLTAVDWLAP